MIGIDAPTDVIGNSITSISSRLQEVDLANILNIHRRVPPEQVPSPSRAMRCRAVERFMASNSERISFFVPFKAGQGQKGIGGSAGV